MTLLRSIVLLVAGVALLILVTPAPQASAHPLSTTAVLLDVGTDQVDATVELPLDELSIARNVELTATTVTDADTLAGLRGYVRDHMSATDETGRAWTTRVTGGVVEQVDGVDTLVLDATLSPAGGRVGDFVLHYDAVMDVVVAHRVFVSARYGDTGSYTTLAMLSWQTMSVPVAAVGDAMIPGATPGSASTGFAAAVRLGMGHVSQGSDHLLFLITLLLPAPLLAEGRRWVRRDHAGRAGWRVLHVVTAFAIGHSITLALGVLGWVHLPTRIVESGIAVSVLISAVHAIRPLVRRGEVLIAASFGLLHGLAFANLLTELDLSPGGLVSALLGFNVGIELTQLLVVALVMPSLMVLSRTTTYAALRTSLAGLAAVLATGWLLERVGALSSDPVAPGGELLVRHPLVLAGGLALLALVALALGAARWAPDAVTPAPPGPADPAVRVHAGRAP